MCMCVCVCARARARAMKLQAVASGILCVYACTLLWTQCWLSAALLTLVDPGQHHAAVAVLSRQHHAAVAVLSRQHHAAVAVLSRQHR